jgi:hypothetical protein
MTGQDPASNNPMMRASPRARRWACILGFTAVCHGCVSHEDIGPRSPEQLRAESTATLCNLVARTVSGKEGPLQELLRRQAISNEHVLQIRDGKIAIGMNTCETTAAWGPPSSFSSSPQIDFAGDPSIVGATMVYSYWMRARVYFGADELVKNVIRTD